MLGKVHVRVLLQLFLQSGFYPADFFDIAQLYASLSVHRSINVRQPLLVPDQEPIILFPIFLDFDSDFLNFSFELLLVELDDAFAKA